MLVGEEVDIHVIGEFDASADRVYTAFLAPQAIIPWFGPIGWSVDPASVIVEPRPYGRYGLLLRCDDDPGHTFALRCRVLELIPGRLIMLEERTAAAQMQIQIDVTRLEQNRCRVDLRQGPYSTDMEAMARVGWESAFAKLRAALRAASPLAA